MNRSRSRNQTGGGPKKGEGSGLSEKSQEPPRATETEEVREETIETEDRSSHEKSKEPETATSDQGRDNEEDTAETKEGESQGKSDEELDSEEEEEEEEGEIEIITPRQAKTKGRKSRKEAREIATYKDKLQGSQLTLEKLMKSSRNTRQQGHALKGMPSASKSK